MRIIRGRASGDTPSQHRTDTFTGTVWADPVLTTEEGHAVNSVTFTPGARTYWHSHAGGQLLVVIAGQGWVCAAGGRPEPIRAGDVVWAPPGERHWHGGTAETIMTHLAVSLGSTSWLDEVSDEDFLAAVAKAAR
jgi:quercetin dioxygenase-like cupin family protein